MSLIKRTTKSVTKPIAITKPKKKKLVALVRKPKRNGFRLNVRSRHSSHRELKDAGIRLPFRSAVRLGSTWVGDGRPRIECNSVTAIKTSASKLLMKQAFDRDGIKTANWIHNSLGSDAEFNAWFNVEDRFPIVAKHIHGSRGTGNYLLKTKEELTAWMANKNLANYIFEKFYNYNREYRLHVTADGCFYSCRKMLKQDTPEEKRWYRNDSNSVWITQYNDAGELKADFDQPVNWDKIVAESVKALKAVGLDIGAIDVRVQSTKKNNGTVREAPEFIILETNSAPSFGEITGIKYKEVIPQILLKKHNQQYAIH
jgi:glutathione synthase/RimK-type ligase-like ATP-grasp enzyme